MTTVPAELPFPTHKAMLGLLGLFDQAADLEPTRPDGLEPGWVMVEWRGLAVADGRRQLLALREEDLPLLDAARQPHGFNVARAVLTQAFQLRGRAGAWQLERILELLHGPRDQRRSRARQAVPVRALVELFCRGHFVLDGELDSTKDKRRPRPGGLKREDYGGAGQGAVLVVDQDEAGQRTVRLGPALADLIGEKTPAVYLPVEEFRLAETGHHNPEGNRPTLATKGRIRWAARLFGKLRASGQPVRFEQLLRWGGVDVERIGRRRHWETHRRELQALLARCDVHLDPFGRARACLLRLAAQRLSRRGLRPERRERRVDRRPPPTATPSGRPDSHGPPRVPATSGEPPTANPPEVTRQP